MELNKARRQNHVKFPLTIIVSFQLITTKGIIADETFTKAVDIHVFDAGGRLVSVMGMQATDDQMVNL